MSRPTEFSLFLADEICELIAEGHSLRSICSTEDMPNKSTVFRWLAANKEFCDQYARARECQADTLADEILDIADDGKGDTYLDAEGNERVDHEAIARSRLRVDARKWIATKLKPRVYGDKVETTHKGDPEAPIQFITRRVVDPSCENS